MQKVNAGSASLLLLLLLGGWLLGGWLEVALRLTEPARRLLDVGFRDDCSSHGRELDLGSLGLLLGTFILRSPPVVSSYLHTPPLALLALVALVCRFSLLSDPGRELLRV